MIPLRKVDCGGGGIIDHKTAIPCPSGGYKEPPKYYPVDEEQRVKDNRLLVCLLMSLSATLGVAFGEWRKSK